MDYEELKANIIGYAENDEPTFVDTIPDFVRQAEKRIYNTVQHPSMKKRHAMVVPAGENIIPVPADYIWTYSVMSTPTGGDDSIYLVNKDHSFIREAYPNPGKQGVPKYYAQTNERELLLGPTPDAGYSLVLEYYGYPESIVDAGTSWLGDHYDMVLLYGSLVEAYTFMKGEVPLLAVYQKRYDDAMSQLKQVGDAKMRQDSYRNGQLRLPVM